MNIVKKISVNLHLLIFFFLLNTYTIHPEIKFSNITLKHGLPSNRTNYCIKDSYSFIWIATDNGLCRFDGTRITVFSTRNQEQYGLTENNIQYLYQKNKNEILILSYDGSLFSYDYQTGKFQNCGLEYSSLANKQIIYFFKDSKKNFWFSTSEGLIKTDSVFRFLNKYSLDNYRADITVSNNIKCICEDKNGILWLGMYSRSLMRFDPKSGKFSQKELLHILPPLQHISSIITSYDKSHLIVATSGEGLIKININDLSSTKWKFDENNFNSLPSDRVTSVVQQNDSLLWTGTLDGLAKINLNSNKITRYVQNPKDPYSIVNNLIYNLFFDNQQILWISTFGGVSKLNTALERFVKVTQLNQSHNTISSNIVNHCLEDKLGNLWIATSKGIDVKDRLTGKYFHYNLPKSSIHHRNEEIVKFFVDEDIWWVATWGGGISKFIFPKNFRAGQKLQFTNFYHDTTDKNSISSNFIRSFAKDNYGNIWITTWNGGVNKIGSTEKSKTKIKFEKFLDTDTSLTHIASNFTDNILIDGKENFWIGTSNGLQKINFKRNESKLIYIDSAKHNSPLNSAVSLILDKNKNDIWAATFGGLVKISGINSVRHSIDIIDKDHPLWSLVQDDEGVLWFSTFNSEIGSYNPKTNKLKFFSMTQEVDGFEFYIGEPTIDKKHNIYFVGKSGYLYFKPQSLYENKFVPPVYITSIRQSGKEIFCNRDIGLIKNLELDYDQRNISISFAALNFINPDNNEYKYLLEGHEKDWISLGNRSEINFANLPHGKYKLKIIGSNNDGIWNYTGTSLALIINPPFWENNYFRLVVLTSICLLIFMFFNSKFKKLKAEKYQQTQLSKLLIESQENERRRLSKELHDSLGQNLLVIKNQIDLYNSTPEKDESDIQKISELVKESILEVKEISNNLHPHQLERLGLIKAVKSMIKQIESSGNIEIETDLDDISGVFSFESEINIFRIIQESLNNVIKHSGSKRAIVEIKNDNQKIRLSIADFGKGFDINNKELQQKLNEGLGLKSIRERTRLINGELKIDSNPGNGTKILVLVNLS